MIVHFGKKKEPNKVLARGLIEVGGENAYTTIWIDKPGV